VLVLVLVVVLVLVLVAALVLVLVLVWQGTRVHTRLPCCPQPPELGPLHGSRPAAWQGPQWRPGAAGNPWPTLANARNSSTP
jgi:hypothetical protein